MVWWSRLTFLFLYKLILPMLFVLRTKTKWERSLQQSKTKADVNIISRKAGSRRSQKAPDSEKGTIMKKSASSNAWKHQSLYIHFHVGLDTKALRQRVPFLSQIADPSPLGWCHQDKLWESLAKAYICWAVSSPLKRIWRCSSFFIQSSTG